MLNIDKMKSKSLIRHFLTVFVVAVALLAAGCSKDSDGSRIAGEGEPVVLDINVASGVSSPHVDKEGKIGRVRIVIFDNNGAMVHNELYTGNYLEENNNRVVIEDFLTGRYSFYLFVNEPVNEKQTYDAIGSIADVMKLKSTIVYDDDLMPNEFPSYANFSHAVTLDNNEVKFMTTILMAKVSVKLKVDHDKFEAGKYPVVNSVELHSIPHYSWVSPQPYKITDPTTDLITTQLHTAIKGVAEDEYEDVYTCTLYIPEYLHAKLDSPRVTLAIYGEMNGGGVDCVWDKEKNDEKNPIYVGDAMGGESTLWNITRGTHYHLEGIISSYGSEVTVVYNIVEWENIDIDDDQI